MPGEAWFLIINHPLFLPTLKAGETLNILIILFPSFFFPGLRTGNYTILPNLHSLISSQMPLCNVQAVPGVGEASEPGHSSSVTAGGPVCPGLSCLVSWRQRRRRGPARSSVSPRSTFTHMLSIQGTHRTTMRQLRLSVLLISKVRYAKLGVD